jgi:hypothetical protein
VKRVSIESDHPIIFLYDPDNSDMEVPAHTRGRLVDFNTTCVAVGTRYRAEGPTDVILCDEAQSANGVLVFEGMIATPNNVIAVNTSERENWISMPTRSAESLLRVWANDRMIPSEIEIRLIK